MARSPLSLASLFFAPGRRSPMLYLGLTAFLASPLATAQEEGFGGDAPAEKSGDTATPAADAPEQYTVQRGDTLWGLSDRFLNNPWYWPKVWSYNPQLDNPNWIRPGTVIRFYPGSGEAVGVAEPEDFAEEDDIYVEDVEVFQGNRAKDALASVLVTANSARRRNEVFATSDELDDAGRVLHSPEDKILLAQNDAVYVDLKNKKDVDGKFHIFRVDRTLYHPITGANLGSVVQVVGELRIDAVSDEESLATLTATWSGVTRGDFVAQLPNLDISSVEPIPQEEVEKEVLGYVVDATTQDTGEAFAEHHLVFLDQGSSAGVKEGHVFTIVRAVDPITGTTRGLADEVIGRALVVHTSDKASTSILLESNREVVAGDRIELRPAKK